MKRQIIGFSRGEKITVGNAKHFLGCFILTDEFNKLSVSWLDSISVDGGSWLVDNLGYEYKEAYVAVPVYKENIQARRCENLIKAITHPNKKVLPSE